MEQNPDLLESTLQLVYQTEEAEAQLAASRANAPLPGCIPPPQDAALLLKIAAAPDQIDQQ
jgi:hypothetical protein